MSDKKVWFVTGASKGLGLTLSARCCLYGSGRAREAGIVLEGRRCKPPTSGVRCSPG